jgi:hypothetical protein
MLKENENILEDDYPLYPNFLYLVDGEPIKNLLGVRTVKELKEVIFKHRGHYPEVRRCDISSRNLWEYAE